jgi:3D (Asp-Asp-Asp) domain-containing protein
MNTYIPVIAVFIGYLTVTTYRPVKEQTDDTPYYTAINVRVYKGGCAVSQDLLKKGVLKYGDTVYVDTVGFFRVNDTMNKRIKKSVDIFCYNLKEQKVTERLIGGKKLRVWLLTGSPPQENYQLVGVGGTTNEY